MSSKSSPILTATMEVYELLTPSKNMEYADPYPIERWDNPLEYLRLLEKMQKLLDLLDTTFESEDPDNYCLGYLATYKTEIENPYNLKEMISLLAGDLYYFSDRWCKERLDAIKWVWSCVV